MHTSASSKGQIVIPSVLRKKYGIKKGTRVEIREEDGKIVLLPRTMQQFEQALKRVRADLKGVDLISALEEERRQDLKQEERKLRGSR
jgi:AbrB family looped-hinge helix DNA binding protein